MRSLASQKIASVLRSEMADGRWKPGQALPSVAALRARFGVGEFAVRAALKRLRDEGFLTVRQHVGAVVTGKAGQAWKGRVAFIVVGANGSYFRHLLACRFARRIEASGYACAQIFLDFAPDGSLDLAPLMRHVANGLDLAVGLLSSSQVVGVLARADIPYVILNGFTCDFPGAVGVVAEDFTAAYDSLVAVLRARKIKSVIEFDYERKMDRGFKRQLFASGIALRRVLVDWKDERPWTLADVKALGHRAVADYFADEKRRKAPPDLILFDDDYLALGGVTALYEAGLRVPDDIRVVFYSNKGNEPVLGVTAARIENDPLTYADQVAEYALKLLKGRKVAPPKIKWHFIPGTSL